MTTTDQGATMTTTSESARAYRSIRFVLANELRLATDAQNLEAIAAVQATIDFVADALADAERDDR